MRPEEFFITGAAALAEPTAESCDAPAATPADPSFWHESAPAAARAAYAAGDQAAGWKAWKRHLLRRKRPAAFRKPRAAARMLTWGNAAVPHAIRLAWLLQLLERRPADSGAGRDMVAASARQWLTEAKSALESAEESAAVGDARAAYELNGGVAVNGQAHAAVVRGGSATAAALESLAWLQLLVARADLLGGPLWWDVWQRLQETARRPAVALEADPLGHQLAAGELPLTLAALFPELQACRSLRTAAAAALSHGMAELLDGEGLPQCRDLAEFPLLVACWTRCRWLGEDLVCGCWNAEAEEQYPRALRELVRLMRPDGSPALRSAPAARDAAGRSPADAGSGTDSRAAMRACAWLAG